MKKSHSRKGGKESSRRKAEDKYSLEYPVRLNKFLAKCGLASRRKSAEIVKNSKVTVNGKVEINPSYMVLESDLVKYKGKTMKPETKKVYILLNKPKDFITTVKDEKDRKTVMSLVEEVRERIFPVGRLDRNTTGLLLFTNDGQLAQKLSHPSSEVRKVYQVVLDKAVSKEDMGRISKGLELEDGPAQIDAVGHLKGRPPNEVGIELHMGKNRIVRRIFEHLGYQVEKLDRTYYAGLTKKSLPQGKFRHLTKQEVIMLKHFV